jgi:hypothetical protein
MTESIHEYDVVALTVDVPEHQLVRGQVGTVVMEHSPETVEVEFVDGDGKTYALLTLPKSNLIRLHHRKVGAA